VEEGKLKAWLAAVTRNTAKNRLRSYHLALPLEDDYFILDVPDVEDELLAQELKKLTREAVSSLPEPEHSIFVRYYFLYQKISEIAEAMDINASTVRTKLLRGREKLKAYLLERGYGCEDSSC
jgi:RNA polymerase sigma-70 factor (ECF subfamily)